MFHKLSDEISTIQIAPVLNLKVIENILTTSKAVIIQAYGMGNIPSNNLRFMDMLKNAIQRDTIIVIMT